MLRITLVVTCIILQTIKSCTCWLLCFTAHISFSYKSSRFEYFLHHDHPLPPPPHLPPLCNFMNIFQLVISMTPLLYT
ncbi:hypothetical protein Hamer_G024729 [Homarus americanus]|uniref:Uncharacterized protein n=1 Tax=Homarus americanus TaxID=6706 RepID=A0A8J5N8I1_HOMAM|nr:hypothetical protein Hamer_G024729 [Homarus americanus]